MTVYNKLLYSTDFMEQMNENADSYLYYAGENIVKVKNQLLPVDCDNLSYWDTACICLSNESV